MSAVKSIIYVYNKTPMSYKKYFFTADCDKVCVTNLKRINKMLNIDK